MKFNSGRRVCSSDESNLLPRRAQGSHHDCHIRRGGDCVRLHRQMLLCDLASGHVDPDELSAATNETLARRGSGGAAPCLGPSMLHPVCGEHVANVFVVRFHAWLCSG